LSAQADPAAFDRASVEAAVTIAARAPSIHNTQPWAWRFGRDGLVLRGDRTRQLAVADPDGHSLLVSCGAALHLTEVALRAQGWRVETTLLPDPADPDALARFRAITRGEPDAQSRTEIDAALRRRSDRRPFDPRPVPPEVVDALRAAAHDHGVWADFPAQKNQMVDLAVAVSWADRVEREDPAYLAEMNRWLRDPDVHAAADGVPIAAIPHVPADRPRHTDVPLRDFEIGVAGGQLIERDVDEKPLIAVIFADGDLPMNQLVAGRAMMRLMLAADLLGLATCPLSQAVDLAAFRARVQQAMGWVGHPQMMLRVGFPGAPTSQLAATPRRELSAVLEVS
jgi:nitroreductase